MLAHVLRYVGIMDADLWFAVRESVAFQRHVAERLFLDVSDDVVRRVLRRVENRLAARLTSGFSTASLERDALALIKRALTREARRCSADLGRMRFERDSPHESLARVASHLTYFEALTDLWLRAGFTLHEIAAEHCSSVQAVQRLQDRALRKLRRANR